MFFKPLIFSAVLFGQASLSAIPQPLFDEIKTLYECYGNDKYLINEEVTQRTHVLQAALIASLAGAPDDVVFALLIHDIGQISSLEYVGQTNFLHAKHDELGAKWLADHDFPQFVSDVVRYHTIAKVILCLEEPAYFESLSLASKESYFIQRDKFLNEKDQVTLHELQNHPRFTDLKCARKCDDMAKILGLGETPDEEGVVLPHFDSYYDLAGRVYNKTNNPPLNLHWREQVNEFHRMMINDRAEFEKMIKTRIKVVLNE